MTRFRKTALPLALLAVGCLYTYRLEKPETRTYPATDVRQLSVSTKNGKIEVGTTSDTAITAHITRVCYGRDEADAERYLRDVTIEDTISDGALVITARMPAGNRTYGANFEVSVRESTACNVTTSNGSVSVAGLVADIAASTSNGEVKLLDTRGRADLSTSSGKVTVTVHRGAVQARTSNGAINCDLAELGPSDQAMLRTSNGPITLLLPADVSATFDARTSNGAITFEGFSNIRFDTNENTHKTGQIGSGAAAVSIETSNGEVVVRSRS